MVINLKNKQWIIFIILFILICIGVFFFITRKDNNKNNNVTNNYTSSKVSSNTNSNSQENNTRNDTKNTIEITKNSTDDKIKKEEEISSFSTKIYSNDASRQNNVYITCSTLNETTIANGSTFSFCNTIGPSTKEKGYQEADIFDKDGNKKKGLGGGNCQVSTTLYNAVLKIPSLSIVERHEHSNKVPYIANGKDAAVAYGSYDLKFKNNTGYDIKIKASATSSAITIALIRLL